MSGIYASATVTRYNGSVTAPVQHCPGKNNKNKNINLHKSEESKERERDREELAGHAALPGQMGMAGWVDGRMEVCQVTTVF